MRNQDMDKTENGRVPDAPAADADALIADSIYEDEEERPDAVPLDSVETGIDDVVPAQPVFGRPAVSPDGSTVAIIQPDQTTPYDLREIGKSG